MTNVTTQTPRIWTIEGPYCVEQETWNGQEVSVVAPVEHQGRTSDIADPAAMTAFAAVSDEGSLLAFVNHYGLLGYSIAHADEMHGRDEHWQGDPVPWALAHARIVAGVLDVVTMVNDLIDRKQSYDTMDAVRLLHARFEKMGVSFSEKPEDRYTSFAWSSPEGGGSVVTGGFDWRIDPVGAACGLLLLLINAQIRFVHYELAIQTEVVFRITRTPPRRFGKSEEEFRRRRLALRLHADTLLEAVYWQLVGRMGEFRQCPVCSRTFPVRDPRMEYCSKRCAGTARGKKFREKRRKQKKQPSKGRARRT